MHPFAYTEAIGPEHLRWYSFPLSVDSMKAALNGLRRFCEISFLFTQFPRKASGLPPGMDSGMIVSGSLPIMAVLVFRCLLLFDVLPDHFDWRSSTRSHEVRSRPENVFSEPPSKVWTTLPQKPARCTFQMPDQI
jgi:hypothetical protein